VLRPLLALVLAVSSWQLFAKAGSPEKVPEKTGTGAAVAAPVPPIKSP
jgi:hypothetical protein